MTEQRPVYYIDTLPQSELRQALGLRADHPMIGIPNSNLVYQQARIREITADPENTLILTLPAASRWRKDLEDKEYSIFEPHKSQDGWPVYSLLKRSGEVITTVRRTPPPKIVVNKTPRLPKNSAIVQRYLSGSL